MEIHKKIKILDQIKHFNNGTSSELSKVLKISEKKAENTLKNLEKEGLIELDIYDKEIDSGVSKEVIMNSKITKKGEKLLKSN